MINVMTTFWRFLNEYTVEIPIIQRDYAQGRLGKEELRKTFLKDLKQALDTCKPLKLDFVYGAMDHGLLNPLDGQQRLTTLWLLHWYLAYMAGAMNKEVKRILGKFTYETRISSREFCRCLADFDKLPPSGTGVVEHIVNQTWFRSAWKDDPTIQSMLRMLGGSTHNYKDGIDGVFHSCYDGECIECRLDQCLYPNAITYWKRLIGTDCPIIFYSLDIHGINQTDDLYIKMNARGKPLTSFENLKADLAGYIHSRAKEFSTDENWKKLDDKETGFAIKMDTDWMDIFWKYHSHDYAVDEIYFAFLIRYLFNAFVFQMKNVGDLQKGDNPIFDFLYGRNAISDGENEKIAYLGFDEVFKKVLDGDNTILLRLYDTLDNFSRFCDGLDNDTENCFEAPWNEEPVSKFKFVPHYMGNGLLSDFAGNSIRMIDHITQPHRVVFHAICKFFEKGWNTAEPKTENAALKDWVRVVWNIVENADFSGVVGMGRCLKLIDELSARSHDIIRAFADGQFQVRYGFAKDQVEEERRKARFISQDRKWEKLFRFAERLSCLKGKVDVLFQSGDNTKMKDFMSRYKLLRRILRKQSTDRFYLQKVLLSHYEEPCPPGRKAFNLSPKEKDLKKLLTFDLKNCFRKMNNDTIKTGRYEWIDCICSTDLLDMCSGTIVGKSNTKAVLWATAGCTWNAYGNIILDRKGEILRNFACLSPLSFVGSSSFISGRDKVRFRYMNHVFEWWPLPNGNEWDIYLLKSENEDDFEKRPRPKIKNNQHDQFHYYCVKKKKDESFSSLCKKLRKLILEYTDINANRRMFLSLLQSRPF